ncbi:serine/threonine protein kinase [Ktedonobacteria bacterium brp13]|nr:serine/threonine protein kinase [Ktedonobacteria bacterium brp13]
MQTQKEETMQTQELIHATIEHYKIERHLARGGMADVFLARDLQQPERTVAIKVVLQGLGEQSERFLREAQAMMSLRHPHILPALGSGSYAAWHYMFMPYAAGGSLRELTGQGPLSIEHTITLLEQIVEAIQYAHDRGILHRDIKASNVLLRNSHYAYLADFGLVKSTTDDYSLTRTGFVLGTPEYMAPELLDNEATPQSDVYALGVLLYLMLTGTLPFKATTPMGVMIKHVQELPPQPTIINPALPPAIETVLAHALMKEPSQRTPSAYMLLQEFRIALDANERTERVPVVQTRPSIAPSLHLGMQADGNPKKLLLVALLVVLCLGLLLVFAFPKSSTSTMTPAPTLQATKTYPNATPSSTPLVYPLKQLHGSEKKHHSNVNH